MTELTVDQLRALDDDALLAEWTAAKPGGLYRRRIEKVIEARVGLPRPSDLLMAMNNARRLEARIGELETVLRDILSDDQADLHIQDGVCYLCGRDGKHAPDCLFAIARRALKG